MIKFQVGDIFYWTKTDNGKGVYRLYKEVKPNHFIFQALHNEVVHSNLIYSSEELRKMAEHAEHFDFIKYIPKKQSKLVKLFYL